jgi:tRNA A37 threonylcarbamoyladenosine modification protein TsaB
MAWPLSALPGIVAPVIDAKKGAFFCALYQDGKRLCDDMDATPAELVSAITAIPPATHYPLTTILGPGAPLLYEQLCAMNLQGGIICGKNLRWGNAAALLRIAQETGIIPANTAIGPEYIRSSC